MASFTRNTLVISESARPDDFARPNQLERHQRCSLRIGAQLKKPQHELTALCRQFVDRVGSHFRVETID
jgi:hypothetical protein